LAVFGKGALCETSLTFKGPETPMPAAFNIYPNYPNPFNPETTIRYELPEQSSVKLDIFNIAGQKLISLVDDVESAG